MTFEGFELKGILCNKDKSGFDATIVYGSKEVASVSVKSNGGIERSITYDKEIAKTVLSILKHIESRKHMGGLEMYQLNEDHAMLVFARILFQISKIEDAYRRLAVDYNAVCNRYHGQRKICIVVALYNGSAFRVCKKASEPSVYQDTLDVSLFTDKHSYVRGFLKDVGKLHDMELCGYAVFTSATYSFNWGIADFLSFHKYL